MSKMATTSAVSDEELISRIRHWQTGFVSKNHKRCMTTTPWAFVGFEAVEWLGKELGITTAEAVARGNKLLKSKVFYAVDGKSDFKNDNVFYRFSNPLKILIVGGGIAGIMLAKQLEKEFDITIVDPKPFFIVPTVMHKVLSDPSLKHLYQTDYSVITPRTKHIQAFATEVAPRSVTLSTGELLTDFDFLVLCTGSRYNLPFTGPRVMNVLDWQERERRTEELKQAKNVTIIGGGPVGIELAAEIACQQPETTVNLVSSGKLGETINADIHDMVVRISSQKFPNLKVYDHQKAVSVSETSVLTDKGVSLESDLIIPCLGFIPNTEALKTHFGEVITSKGYIKTNIPTMQVLGHEHVFALGDIVEMDRPRQAAYAGLEADALAAALRLYNVHEPAAPYVLKSKENGEQMMIMSLGPSNAALVKNYVSGGKGILTAGYLASLVLKFAYSRVRAIAAPNK